MSASPTPQSDLSAVNVASLRARWERVAAEVGRDLAGANAVTVARSMEQLANLEAYIALIESHRHAQRARWRRWDFWRRIILTLAVFATFALLFLAFTHPSRANVRFDLHASSVVFYTSDDVRLTFGRRFETLSVTGLERLTFPVQGEERVITNRQLIVSSDRDSGGRFDWIHIAGGSTVRVRASGRETSVRISTEPRQGEATPANALPAARFTMDAGTHISVASGQDEFSEGHIAVGTAGRSASIEGVCPTFPARMEVSVLFAEDGATDESAFRLSRLSGVAISQLACTTDDIVSGVRQSTLISGEVEFPDIEVPHVQLNEATQLTIKDFDGALVRVELGSDGVHVIAEGDASEVLAGHDGNRSLLPSRLESLFARRFRMYTAGVLMYALVFIIALLKGEKASIGEGFRPHSLMGMVRGGGHL